MSENLEKQFLKILEAHQQRINAICSVYAANKADQEDLVQEVVLNIWKSLPNFRAESAIETWVYRIILNVCLKKSYKQKKAQRTLSLDSIAFEPSTQQSELKPELEALKGCITKLDFADRSIIILYLEELSYKEIGELIGISENYVAVKLKRIKKKLTTCLKITLHER